MSALTENYSGVVIDQNAPASSHSTSAFAQTFTLPTDYVRGATGTSQIIPDLTGFQVYTNVTNASTCSLTWNLQVNDPINGTITIASGTNTGTAETGNTWFGVILEDSIPISTTWLTAIFTLNITAVANMTVGYSSGPTLMYRILAAVADGGTDFLGNVYRSAILESVVENTNTFQSSSVFSSWMSNPCPSTFGVESLYLDMRQGGESIVVDRLTIDPITPGVYFHIYYSNDPTGPGIDIPSWENLLWTPVYQTYQVNRMQTFALPEPITAKYICIEFTNLQTHHYGAGNFQLPATYKKYPKWVLDYFLAQFKVQGVDRLSSGVNITYDAIDLAYSAYSTDIIQEPDPPLLSQVPVSQLNPFVNPPTILDPTTLSKISLNFQPYLQQPALRGDNQSAISQFAASNPFRTYSTEVISTAIGDTNTVSNLQRDALLIEKSFPIMFFYLPCRHAFRLAQANFETDVAYFAGVKQLVFHRDVYTSYADQDQYNENLGDGTNLLFNDFADPQALP